MRSKRATTLFPLKTAGGIGFPEWDRYGLGHPPLSDYPYEEGHWWDPYNQNVLKGDYPIIGQHTFLNITPSTLAIVEERQVPRCHKPVRKHPRPGQTDFFGRPNQFFYSQNFNLGIDLFHGDAAFKPVDWRIKLSRSSM